MIDFINSLDKEIMFFISENFKSDFCDKIMPIITSIGNKGFVWIVISIILFFQEKTRKYSYMMITSLLGSLIIGNIILKLTIRRPRPFDVFNYIELLIKKPLDFSFPSGHTMTAFACSFIIYSFNKKLGFISFVLALLIAYSRVYLFVHFPSDIIAGAIIGIIIAYLSKKFIQYFYK